MRHSGSSMFRIVFTPEAIDDLRQFRKYEQQHIVAAIETQLLHQPAHETRHRKRLRPNALAEWELRVQTFPVFYDVDVAQRVVKSAAVGYKEGNTLFLHGEEYQL